MTRNLDAISTDFDSMTGSDFDNESSGMERLYKLCNELLEMKNPATCAPILFRTMERLDDVDLGSPGPLVHTLECWQGTYENLLVESLRRKPVFLSVWMVNRILNINPPDAHEWLKLLQSVSKHPLASEATKAEAEEFIQYQFDAVHDG